MTQFDLEEWKKEADEWRQQGIVLRQKLEAENKELFEQYRAVCAALAALPKEVKNQEVSPAPSPSEHSPLKLKMASSTDPQEQDHQGLEKPSSEQS